MRPAQNCCIRALTPPLPPNIEMIGRLEFGTDKPGKDTNFRGITIFNNTLYVAKGSGGNGINTVYQAGTAGTLAHRVGRHLGNRAADHPAWIPQHRRQHNHCVSLRHLVRRRQHAVCLR